MLFYLRRAQGNRYTVEEENKMPLTPFLASHIFNKAKIKTTIVLATYAEF